MNTKASIASLLTGFATLTLAGAAHANLYNLNVQGVPGIETGSYHVVLSSTNNNTDWQVVSIQANSGANTPSADVFRVRMYFYSSKNGTGVNLGGLGFTAGNKAGTNAAGTNWGAGAVGGGGGNPQFQHYAQYLNPSTNHGVGPNNILMNGSNVFSQNGAFTLSAASAAKLGSFEIQLNDGSSFVDVVDVPEASSLALLLPGLVPLGFALRRRRMSRQAA